MKPLSLMILLGTLLGACTQDVQTHIDPDSDGALADAGQDTGANGQTEGDAGCEQTPQPGWCYDDLGLPPPPPPMDAGKPDADKPEEDKPDGGRDDFKKESGWEGRIADDLASYTFTQLSEDEVVCQVSYEFTDRRQVNDCAACAEAFEAVLGPANVELNTGNCGPATERAGEQVYFGHGRDGDGAGNHGLYIRKNGRWNKLNGGTSSMSDEGWFFTHPDLADDPGPMGDEAGIFMTGELDLDTTVGAYRFYSSRGDGTLNCEVNYPVANGIPAEGCRQCAFSWNFPLGQPDRRRRGPDCQFFEGLAGITVTYGHSDGGQLYVLKEGRWSAAGGSSIVEGSVWRFRVNLGR